MSSDAARSTGMSDDTFKSMIAIIMAVVTLIATGIAFLQGDASARDDRANRDTKRYSIEALGRQISGDARTNYDYGTAYQAVNELDILAIAAEERGDDAAAARYRTVREQMIGLSPLLAPAYYDGKEALDIAKYETDTYLVEITALRERFAAASVVKDTWDAKANTYIVHLTLLAVALFLFGMALAIAIPATRWLFTIAGLVISGIATVWAVLIFLQPVYDLRLRQGAIESYAKGVGLEYQGLHDQAIAAFTESISAAPTYANAFAERAGSYIALGKYEDAAKDYVSAREAGNESTYVAGNLALMYHYLGRFDEAIAMNKTALETTPNELWVRFDQGLTLLSSGQVDAARAEYKQGMDFATTEVAEARSAGKEPPSDMWSALDDASLELDELISTLQTGEGTPPKDKLKSPDTLAAPAKELSTQLKSLAVGLEYNGKPPTGTLSAKITPFTFGSDVVYNDAGEIEDMTVDDVFEAGTQEVLVQFDYEAMSDGQEVLFKVYIDGTEDPSWRVIFPWDAGPSGTYFKPLSVSYSDVFVLPTGYYTVEMYVDSHLAQSGSFTIE